MREDIVRQLHLGEAPRKPPFVEVLGFSRPNLRIGVTDCSRAARKLARTLEIVNRLKSGIIYVATRKHAQTVYEELQRAVSASRGVEILMYHAALTEAQRTKVQRAFMTAEHPVVIATTAFGMGIDRADIRFVVHWDIPGGIEQYYQEVVRCLAPIIHKVGVPSGERLDAAIRAGRISSELVEGAVTRQGDFSFAVQRRDARLAG